MGDARSPGLGRVGAFVALAGSALALSLGPTATATEELPRYRFTPGQVLVYRSVDLADDFEVGGGDQLVIRGDYEWIFYVVRQDGEGAWRIAFSQTWKSRVLSPHAGDKKLGPPTILYDDGFFNLTTDGQATENWTIYSFANPLLVFPLLPPTAESFAMSWQANLSVDRTRRTLRVAPDRRASDSPRLELAEDDERYEDAAHLTTRRRELTFDRQRGLVTRAVTHTRENWAKVIRPAVPIELAEERSLSVDDQAKLTADCDRYFAAREVADDCLRRADAERPHVEQWLAKARAAMAPLRDQLQSPAFREILARRVEKQADEADRYQRRSEKYGPLLDTASPDWTTTDLDGITHSLRDYRGKILVLDFWFRSCTWCIRAMPEMTELAGETDRSRVVVLSVNMDRQEEDARFVAGALKLNYPTLLNGEVGEGIDKKYLVDSGPTVIVIDQQGTIRHIHLGFTPTLGRSCGMKSGRLKALR